MSLPSNSNNHPSLCNLNPWCQNANTIWLGTTLTLKRNLEKYHFPGKLSMDKQKQVVSILAKILLDSEQLKNQKLYKAEELNPLEKEFLMEHFLTTERFTQAQSGEGFVLDETGEFLGLINLRDHLSLIYIDPQDQIEESWEKLSKLEMEINKSVAFAFNSKFGFLASDPNQSGTSLIVYIFLHLPALIYLEGLERVVEKNLEDGIEQTGFQGNPKELIGDIAAFHNTYTLGITEESIISSMRSLAIKLVAEEKSARKSIRDELPLADVGNLKDKVSRAYGVLLHSYQIETIEALQSISMIKLGLDLGWVGGVSQAKLNELLFNCRRGHLLCQLQEKQSAELLSHRRAEYIHSVLKGITLLI